MGYYFLYLKHEKEIADIKADDLFARAQKGILIEFWREADTSEAASTHRVDRTSLNPASIDREHF